MRYVFGLCLVVLALIYSGKVHAEAVKIVCEFRFYSDLNGSSPVKDGFALTFQYDSISNDAFIIGNQGLSPVHLIRAESGMSFLEPLRTGAVQTTTVDSKMFVVHSRHTIINGNLEPSQYYGQCK